MKIPQGTKKATDQFLDGIQYTQHFHLDLPLGAVVARGAQRYDAHLHLLARASQETEVLMNC